MAGRRGAEHGITLLGRKDVAGKRPTRATEHSGSGQWPRPHGPHLRLARAIKPSPTNAGILKQKRRFVSARRRSTSGNTPPPPLAAGTHAGQLGFPLEHAGGAAGYRPSCGIGGILSRQPVRQIPRAGPHFVPARQLAHPLPSPQNSHFHCGQGLPVQPSGGVAFGKTGRRSTGRRHRQN